MTQTWLSPIVVLLAASMSLNGFAADETEAPSTYRIEKDIPYRDGSEMEANPDIAERCRLDLYLPDNQKDFATVIWFHGGGLREGQKSIPKKLERQGFAVVAANYRLFPKAKCPEYIEDAAAAVAWTFKNIKKHGGDPEKIFVSGSSAGGYLTCMVGLDKSYLAQHKINADRIAGLIPLSPQVVTHFTIREEAGIPKEQPLIDRFAPLFHVRDDSPPLVLVTGDREREMLGRYEENAYMMRMMKVAGHRKTELYELQGSNHGEMVSPGLEILTRHVQSFLKSQPTVIKELEYAQVDGNRLKLDLYLPNSGQRPRLVMFIHGGGWQAGDKAGCPLKWLAREGYAVASINYRLTDVATFPAQIHDCKGAARWLKSQAAKYGYNADHLIVSGDSAGGHLAALMGTSGGVKELEGDVGGNLNQSSRVAQVIDYFGATDFILRSKTQPLRANAPGSVVYRLLGGGADQKIELAQLASPVFHVTPDDPPFLVFHGDQDQTVLIDQTKRLDEVYRHAKLPITVHILKNSGHGGDEFYHGKSRLRILDFLKLHAP